MKRTYKKVCVAGTFDGIHKGHEALLKSAFSKGERVCIGITSDAYVRRYKKARRIASYAARHKAIEVWLKKENVASRADIVILHDPFGPAVTDNSIDALIVSEISKHRGDEINSIRLKNNISPLSLIIVPMVLAQDKKPISASRVATGEISKTGRLTLPDNMRHELALPLGRVLTHSQFQEALVQSRQLCITAVGDLTTKTVLESGRIPNLMIIDNKVNRVSFGLLSPILKQNNFPTQTVVSGPGYISSEAVEAISRFFDGDQKPFVLEVSGEEDLLALPTVAHAPIGSVVYYGQPPVPMWACGPVAEGVVEVVVTKEKKDQTIAILSKFLHNR